MTRVPWSHLLSCAQKFGHLLDILDSIEPEQYLGRGWGLLVLQRSAAQEQFSENIRSEPMELVPGCPGHPLRVGIHQKCLVEYHMHRTRTYEYLADFTKHLYTHTAWSLKRKHHRPSKTVASASTPQPPMQLEERQCPVSRRNQLPGDPSPGPADGFGATPAVKTPNGSSMVFLLQFERFSLAREGWRSQILQMLGGHCESAL